MAKILIIEDDSKLRKNLSLLLTSEGFDVITAENGKIGIDLAKKVKPDLIICDIMMPEADGYEVINEISKDDGTNSIPFIFLTAKSIIDDFRTGMNYDADDYILSDLNSLNVNLSSLISKFKANGIEIGHTFLKENGKLVEIPKNGK